MTDSIDKGIASLQEHKVYIDNLSQDFDPEMFLSFGAAAIGETAGCDYAVGFSLMEVNSPPPFNSPSPFHSEGAGHKSRTLPRSLIQYLYWGGQSQIPVRKPLIEVNSESMRPRSSVGLAITSTQLHSPCSLSVVYGNPGVAPCHPHPYNFDKY